MRSSATSSASFAVLAPNREGQRTQAPLRNLLAALETISVGALIQPRQRLIDLVESFRLHLNERELDIWHCQHTGFALSGTSGAA
jgi:hypothetical protein